MISWAYLAGFLDGDGWITSSKNKNCTTRRYLVGFTQKRTECRYMLEMHHFLQANGIRSTVLKRVSKTPLVPRRVRMIDIHVREQESIVRLLEQLTPHLLIKKEKAMGCIGYLKDRLDKRGALVGPVKQQETNVYWSQAQIQELLQLHAEGHGNRSIASKLNRSMDSVAHKLYRLGLTRRAA